MSQATHTSGPWKFYTSVGCRYVQAGDQRDIAADANARLIAAAPDLLAACKQTTQHLRDLLAAIAELGLTDNFIDDSINMLSEGQTAVESGETAIARAEKKE